MGGIGNIGKAVQNMDFGYIDKKYGNGDGKVSGSEISGYRKDVKKDEDAYPSFKAHNETMERIYRHNEPGPGVMPVEIDKLEDFKKELANFGPDILRKSGDPQDIKGALDKLVSFMK